MHSLLFLAWMIILLPLAGSIMVGLGGKKIGKSVTHWITVSLVGISFLLSCYVCGVMLSGHPPVEGTLYSWIRSGSFHFDVALLVDRLSAVMICVVTFVSLMVHIYTIGYMADDPGYQRFFSYVSLFTFAMLILVLANNFLLLFFGWEGVGLVSYLLIGFWFHRESAVAGGLKAFIANRVGDVGFILAIAGVLMYFGTLHYQDVFTQVNKISGEQIILFSHTSISVITLICVLLFIGAMGKSAQIPLHVWLPESMEGPTPISALIHAATMVTAGIYMVARLSPLFEYSPATLSFILIIGATTCLFMGLLAIFQHDIKRVIAYSTLSQLGYMTIALGASAYNAAIFHLITHAFFKALLFLSAGSVIIALHHEQDMRKMGGLAPYMPITYLTFIIGALSLSAIPPFSGFYSKDSIIEAVHLSELFGGKYAYACALVGAFITPLYIFRAVFLTFHGKCKMEKPVRESPWVVLIPLIALAIPSIVAGGMLIGPILFSPLPLLGKSTFVLLQHDVLLSLSRDYFGAKQMAIDSSHTLSFWLAMMGIITAWLFFLVFPEWSGTLKKRFSFLYSVMTNQYGFNEFNDRVLIRGTRKLGEFFYQISDLKMIDGLFVNGSGHAIQWFAKTARRFQTGYLYHYALVMIVGVVILTSWLLL